MFRSAIAIGIGAIAVLCIYLVQPVDASHPPTASFQYVSKDPHPGSLVKFTAGDNTDSEHGDPGFFQHSYAWDLDADGQFDDATGKTAERLFPSKGDFAISLRVRVDIPDNPTQEDTVTHTVFVRPPAPAARVQRFPSKVFQGDFETFTAVAEEAQAEGGYDYKFRWDMDGDGEIDDSNHDGVFDTQGSKVKKQYFDPGRRTVNMEVDVSLHGEYRDTRKAGISFTVQPFPADGDTDKDTIANGSDNCPYVANTDQANVDSDELGDACDSDADGDGIANNVDNCRDVSNAPAPQADLDDDGLGDACDPDTEGDSVENTADNCVVVKNTDQADADKDGMGDLCDGDDDNDGHLDDVDQCPTTFGQGDAFLQRQGCPPNQPPHVGMQCGFDPSKDAHFDPRSLGGQVSPSAAAGLAAPHRRRNARLRPAIVKNPGGVCRPTALATRPHRFVVKSADPDGKVVAHLWDLDGNGSFETNTHEIPYVTKTYPKPGEAEINVKVVDDALGFSDEFNVKVKIEQPPCEVALEIDRIVAQSKCFLPTIKNGKTVYTSKTAVNFNGIAIVPKGGSDVRFVVKSDTSPREGSQDDLRRKARRKRTSIVGATALTEVKFDSVESADAKVSATLGAEELTLHTGKVDWGVSNQRITNFKVPASLKINDLASIPAPPSTKVSGNAPWLYKAGAAKIGFYTQLPSVFTGSPTPSQPKDALVIDTGKTDLTKAAKFGAEFDPTTGAGSFTVEDAHIGPVHLKKLVVAFDGLDFWQITADVALPPPIPYEISGGVGIRGGAFEYGWAKVDNLNVAIGPVGLKSIQIGIAVKPETTAGVEKCVPQIGKKTYSAKEITDRFLADYTNYNNLQLLKYAAAHGNNPFDTTPFEIDYGKPDFVFCGEIELTVPPAVPVVSLDVGGGFAAYPDYTVVRVFGDLSLLDIKLFTAQASIYSDGYIDMGASVNAKLGGVASIKGGFDFVGDFRKKPYRFNAEMYIKACLDFVDMCAGARGLVSTKGIAMCLSLDLLFFEWSPGFGYEWGGEFTPYFTGCSVGPYREKITRTRRKAGGIRSASFVAGDEQTIDLPPGLPGGVVMATGETAPPKITLVGPNGERITTPDDEKSVQQAPFLLIKDAKGNHTSIAIARPAAGTWRVIVDEGSSPVTSIKSAEGLDKPKVSAKVSGKGATRTLTYSLTPREGQVVRFYEEGGSGGTPIGTATKANGKITWVPAAGAAEPRAISAVVEQDGFARDKINVARYVAPKAPRPSKPGKPKALVRKGALQVSWSKATNAKTYRVLAMLSDRRRIMLTTKKTRVSIKRLGGVRSGSVTIQGITPDGLAGGKASVRFPSNKRKR